MWALFIISFAGLVISLRELLKNRQGQHKYYR